MSDREKLILFSLSLKCSNVAAIWYAHLKSSYVHYFKPSIRFKNNFEGSFVYSTAKVQRLVTWSFIFVFSIVITT